MRYWVFAILILAWSSWCIAADHPVKIRRICNDGSNITLYWFPTTDTCSAFQKYYIWARNGSSGSFILIDSVANKAAETYTHINANAGSGTKNWSYFITHLDSCGPAFLVSSDTVAVDNAQVFQSFIDSVSVDPITGKVVIGWHSNQAPDFQVYQPVRDNGNFQYVFLGDTRDTSIVDPLPDSDPSIKPIKYDLNTKDSCGNAGFFGENPHRTIYLRATPDTCKKTCLLSWTPYGFKENGTNYGWRVSKYCIFKSIDAGPFIQINSGIDTFYTDPIILGQQITYYIRAFKDTTIIITSSSNLSRFTTRLRIEPTHTYLQNVSVDPIQNSPITVKVRRESSDEWLRFDVFRSAGEGFAKIGEISNDNLNSTNYTFLDPVDAGEQTYQYQVQAINVCGLSVYQSNVSRSIFLKASGNGAQNNLSWNNYSGWDNGVEKYRLYRGTNADDQTIYYSLLDSIINGDSSYIDQALPDRIGSLGVCYYLEAVQTDGSAYGVKESSFSNHSCVTGDMIIYIPNAFNPVGANPTFRPEGSFIDYSKSSMEIFDRWGGKVIQIFDISLGWDGKYPDNQSAMQGVYFYKMMIRSTNGTQQIKTGTVTLLN